MRFGCIWAMLSSLTVSSLASAGFTQGPSTAAISASTYLSGVVPPGQVFPGDWYGKSESESLADGGGFNLSASTTLTNGDIQNTSRASGGGWIAGNGSPISGFAHFSNDFNLIKPHASGAGNEGQGYLTSQFNYDGVPSLNTLRILAHVSMSEGFGGSVGQIQFNYQYFDLPNGVHEFELPLPQESMGVLLRAAGHGVAWWGAAGSETGSFTTTFRWGINGLPGESRGNPLSPLPPASSGGARLPVIEKGEGDPTYADGDDDLANEPQDIAGAFLVSPSINFRVVELPESYGDVDFEVLVQGHAPVTIAAGSTFDFTTLDPAGVDRFAVRVTDPYAASMLPSYVLGISLMSAGYSEVSWTTLFNHEAGDFNGDEHVDGSDFLRWQRGLGVIYSDADLLDWQQNFSASSTGAGLAAVPEPSCGVLLAVALAAACYSRRRAALATNG